MNKKEYNKLVTKLTPKPKCIKNGIIAFIIGGFIGLLAEIIDRLLQNTFNIPPVDSIVWVIIIFIFIGSFLTAIHLFDDLVAIARAGLIIPITGFAHSIASAAMDYKSDGMITGLGANFFKLAGSVLLYGISSAFLLTILKVIIYG